MTRYLVPDETAPAPAENEEPVRRECTATEWATWATAQGIPVSGYVLEDVARENGGAQNSEG